MADLSREVCALIGAGGLAHALAPALLAAGARLRIASRDPRRARALVRGLRSRRACACQRAEEAMEGATLVLLCVRDDVLRALAERLAAGGSLRGRVFLHASGFQGEEVLEALAARGAAVGALHPLLPLPRGSRSRAVFEGAWFATGGERRARSAARRLVRGLGGRELRLEPGRKAEYHLAATLVSNGALALFELARRRFARAAADPRAARAAFASLLAATAANLGRADPEQALTGAIARGDVASVRGHLALLAGSEERESYRALGRVLLALAGRRGGLVPARRRELARLLR